MMRNALDISCANRVGNVRVDSESTLKRKGYRIGERRNLENCLILDRVWGFESLPFRQK